MRNRNRRESLPLSVRSRRGTSLLFDGRQIHWKRSHLSVTPQRTGGEERRAEDLFSNLVPKIKKLRKKKKTKKRHGECLSPHLLLYSSFFLLAPLSRSGRARLSCVEGIVYPQSPLAVEREVSGDGHTTLLLLRQPLTPALKVHSAAAALAAHPCCETSPLIQQQI